MDIPVRYYFKPDLERIQNTFISKHWDFQLREPVSSQVTLFAVLETLFPHIDSDSWEARLSWGGLFRNGKKILTNQVISFPCRLEYYEPLFDYSHPHSVFPEFTKERIVYEDEFILIYSKPSGLPSVPAREQTVHNLRSYLEHYVGGSIHMPSRLDMSTEGLVPVSKSPITHHALQLVYEKRKVEKTYIFEAEKKPPWKKLKIETFIKKHPDHPVLRCADQTEGKHALTHFEFLSRTPQGTVLIKAIPFTGRTHQIRIHAHHVFCSIIGDNFYGGAPLSPLRLMCYRLSFPHPLTQEPLTISIPEHLLPAWSIKVSSLAKNRF